MVFQATNPGRVKVEREEKSVSTQPGEAPAPGRLRGVGREWGGRSGRCVVVGPVKTSMIQRVQGPAVILLAEGSSEMRLEKASWPRSVSRRAGEGAWVGWREMGREAVSQEGQCSP